ncbi:MAG: formyltransferase [Elusimicrobiaceae bacterium]|nr:formyltransferase [Elusimicrobiaceae bacterium]
MRAIIFAYQELGYICLEEVLKARYEVAAVITHPDNPGEEIWFRSVAGLAREHDIPVYETDTFKRDDWHDRIAALKPDIMFSCMFRKMIHSDILALAPEGAYNLHPSYLPKYRGRCPANWALANGESYTGLTLHRMVRSADAGNIVSQVKVPIGPADDVRDLYASFAAALPGFIAGPLRAMKTGRHTETPQDDSEATVFGGRTPQDGAIDWAWPALKIHNLVRAVAHPYPGAFCDCGQRGRLFIWKTEPPADCAAPDGAVPGSVLSVNPPSVRCGEGILVPKILQWENGPELPAQEFAAKYNLRPGDLITARSEAK